MNSLWTSTPAICRHASKTIYDVLRAVIVRPLHFPPKSWPVIESAASDTKTHDAAAVIQHVIVPKTHDAAAVIQHVIVPKLAKHCQKSHNVAIPAAGALIELRTHNNTAMMTDMSNKIEETLSINLYDQRYLCHSVACLE